jgi:hypothetical protein
MATIQTQRTRNHPALTRVADSVHEAIAALEALRLAAEAGEAGDDPEEAADLAEHTRGALYNLTLYHGILDGNYLAID